jgi:hypothetical protein
LDSDEPENPPGDPALLGGKPPLAAGKDPSRKERDIRDDLNAFEKQSVKLQRRLFLATIAIWVTTGIYVFVTYRQWRTMQDQLGVMNNQLSDTRKADIETNKVTERQLKIAESQTASMAKLANASKMSADNSYRIAEATKEVAGANQRQLIIAESQSRSLSSQAESVRLEAEAMGRQAAAMKTLSDANMAIAEAANANVETAKRTAATSAHQLEVTDRPWLSVTVSITEPVTFVPAVMPAPFTPEVRRAVWTRGEIKLTNTGRSVADDIHVESRMTFDSNLRVPWFTFGQPDKSDKLAAEMCDFAIKNLTSGSVLFPGDKLGESRRYFIPLTNSNQGEVLTKPIELDVIGCATYRFSNSPTLHRTWFTYRVGVRAPRDDRWSLYVSNGIAWQFDIGKYIKTIPLRNVVIEKFANGGNGAD